MREATITICTTDHDGAAWAQKMLVREHYLHAPVDPRCRALIYLVSVERRYVGCLIFGRPESTRCYRGDLTYGSQSDVIAGRAQFDRWEVLNLARVWFDPCVQRPGYGLYHPRYLPGFIDRRGVFRSTLASWAITRALGKVGYDYLAAHPPVDCAYPYQLRAVLSYCDRRLHRGTIYHAAGFQLARTNTNQIETWYTPAVAPLDAEQDADIRRRADVSRRSQRIRGQRMQLKLDL